jgi:CRISPR-associated protein Csx10
VFVDVAGRPRLDPDPTLDLPDGVRVERAWVRRMVWSGWHAASRLPKPTEVCAMPGSTYRLTSDPQTLTDLARQVIDEGMGLRRVEGFGVAEIATTPWRPPQPQASAATDRAAASAAPTRPSAAVVSQRLQMLLNLNLEPPEQRWLVSALRALQIEQQRTLPGAASPTAIDAVLDELLAQPTPAALTGRQREAVRTALADLDTIALRDLTTLVADALRDTATSRDATGTAS